MTPTLRRQLIAAHPDRPGGSHERFVALTAKLSAERPHVPAHPMDRLVLNILRDKSPRATTELAGAIYEDGPQKKHVTAVVRALERLMKTRSVHLVGRRKAKTSRSVFVSYWSEGPAPVKLQEARA